MVQVVCGAGALHCATGNCCASKAKARYSVTAAEPEGALQLATILLPSARALTSRGAPTAAGELTAPPEPDEPEPDEPEPEDPEPAPPAAAPEPAAPAAAPEPAAPAAPAAAPDGSPALAPPTPAPTSGELAAAGLPASAVAPGEATGVGVRAKVLAAAGLVAASSPPAEPASAEQPAATMPATAISSSGRTRAFRRLTGSLCNGARTDRVGYPGAGVEGTSLPAPGWLGRPPAASGGITEAVAAAGSPARTPPTAARDR